MKLRWAIVIAASIISPLPCEAFWAVSGDNNTHQKLTEHAIAQMDKSEFPDIYKFKEKKIYPNLPSILMGGVTNEDSHSHRWRGNWEFWEKKVVAAYELGYFNEAYEMLGNAIHLYQDDEVPAHQKYCFHGLGNKFYSYVDMPEHGGIGNPDQLENFALFYHAEIPNPNGWDKSYQDAKGDEWKYWLNDAEDQDIGESGWGAYGKPKEKFTPITTASGVDWYTEDGSIVYGTLHPEIAWGQLYKARNDTKERLEDLSKNLPPLIRELKLTAKSKPIGGKNWFFVGPKKGGILQQQVLGGQTRPLRTQRRKDPLLRAMVRSRL